MAAIRATRVGAHPLGDRRWEFLLWAPNSKNVALQLCDRQELVPMQREDRGYHRVVVPDLEPGTRYLFRLEDGRELPDPASRFQPDGVHKPSALVDTSAFRWTDHDWKAAPLESGIFYELHVGTYTDEGTFDGLIRHLPDLVKLGITVVEVMPVAQFPGARNWGYDGVYPFAAQNSYGGPAGLQRFVDAAHAHGLAVALDVVYNHLGPEGNYLSAYGPYFTDRYRTPWGQAINYDGEGSDEVRRFFLENALYWLEDFHIDALRLDAVHGIFDFSAQHFLAELQCKVDELAARLDRPLYLIAESDLNDSRLLRDPAGGGYGLNTQWADDFHHSVHTLLTGEKRGYYADFGGIAPLEESLRDGWCYRGQYSVHRQRRHGNSPEGLPPSKFVVCTQNHDQVGNRAEGDRLSSLVNFEKLKLAAGASLLSPFLPLLFMGEEYGETAPFQYFTSHGDPDLVEAVRRGRREEFAAFGWQGTVPDPQEESTFHRSRLDHRLKEKEPHKTLRNLYRQLIEVRRDFRLGSDIPRRVSRLEDEAVAVHYQIQSEEVIVLLNFGRTAARLTLTELGGQWNIVLNSAANEWRGPDPDPHQGQTIALHDGVLVSPYSFLLLKRVQSQRRRE